MKQGENNFKSSKEGNYNNNNNPFWWQRPLGKSIFVIFCCGIRRDEEKETQNINVVGKKTKCLRELSKQFGAPGVADFQSIAEIR